MSARVPWLAGGSSVPSLCKRCLTAGLLTGIFTEKKPRKLDLARLLASPGSVRQQTNLTQRHKSSASILRVCICHLLSVREGKQKYENPPGCGPGVLGTYGRLKALPSCGLCGTQGEALRAGTVLTEGFISCHTPSRTGGEGRTLPQLCPPSVATRPTL